MTHKRHPAPSGPQAASDDHWRCSCFGLQLDGRRPRLARTARKFYWRSRTSAARPARRGAPFSMISSARAAQAAVSDCRWLGRTGAGTGFAMADLPAQRCTLHKHQSARPRAERPHDEISAEYNDMIYATRPRRSSSAGEPSCADGGSMQGRRRPPAGSRWPALYLYKVAP